MHPASMPALHRFVFLLVTSCSTSHFVRDQSKNTGKEEGSRAMHGLTHNLFQIMWPQMNWSKKMSPTFWFPSFLPKF
jgi:hypothetical protein